MRRSTPNTILINVCQVSLVLFRAGSSCSDSLCRLRAVLKSRRETQSSPTFAAWPGSMETSSVTTKSAQRRALSTSRELVRCPASFALADHVPADSLRYHLLHPEYIHGRIKNLAHSYALRLMIVHCDVDNHQAAMKELTKVCIVNEYTMIVAWR